MVARKKLRKHSKLKRGNLRLSNMLQTPGSNRLEMAKIDIPGKGVGKMVGGTQSWNVGRKGSGGPLGL
jgi:hypothetical protein